MGPLISVIIPSYGGAKYLSRAINSVLSQTYQSIEVIVVDDNGIGSENQISTALVVNEFKSDERVKYICHKTNRNGSAARNTGVQNSRGEYIALLDDDDVFFPEKLQRQVEDMTLLSNDFAFNYCGHDTYIGDRKVGEIFATESGALFYEYIAHNIEIASSSILIRKNVYLEVGGFDESFKRHQDWEFLSRVLFKYSAHALNFMGFRRYLERRNSSTSPEMAWERRTHFLTKMSQYISTLPENKQKEVRVNNKMDIVISYLKQKRFKEFFVQFFKANESIYGCKFMILRAVEIIKRRKLIIK